MPKRRLYLIAAVIFAVGVLGACGAGRPYHYYWLDATTAPQTATQTPPYQIKLLVGHPYTPQLYRDDRLVYGSGEEQLGVYEYERWAEMPADMIQEALVNSLRKTGQFRSVTRTGSSAHGDYIARSRLYAMYGVDQPQLVARFSMDLELFDTKTGTTVWSAPYSHDEPVDGKSVPNLVAAMDRNVRAGMQQLTAGLMQYFASHPPETAEPK
jgi:ABC-type uncharacterized transport system auxiliary subunit